jgi:hypothetical protein
LGNLNDTRRGPDNNEDFKMEEVYVPEFLDDNQMANLAET